VIVRTGLFQCLLAFGAIAQPEPIAPAEEGAPSPAAFGQNQLDNAKPTSIKIDWQRPVDSKTQKPCACVSGVDTSILATLASPRMTTALWASFFRVHVVSESKRAAKDVPPIWGAYRIDGKLIRFEPRFPPEPGIRYRASFEPARLTEVVKELSPSLAVDWAKSSESPLTSEFFLPKSAEASTKITAVYPSGERLPENLLRLYIHFSAPMSRGEAYRHLKLIDVTTKKPVHAPFLELEEELWSPDGKRFTLLIDPGRIKRGLKPREMFGPVLEAGKAYELIVDREWTDAHGNALASEFRRSFRAGPPDEAMPNPKAWTIRPPRARGLEALEVRFPEQLDCALAQRLIAVLDSEGKDVLGRVIIAESETVWRFIPEAPWRLGTYRLAIGTELEDVAGNSVAAPFEVDLTEQITKRVASDRVEVPFSTVTSEVSRRGVP
jgi:hypothetical protein